MLFSSRDLINELQRERLKTDLAQRALIDEVHRLIQEGESADAVLIRRLEQSRKDSPVSIAFYSEKNVFSLETIRSICIRYRLRFLPSSYYRPAFPYEAFVKIRELERDNDTSIQEFYVMAPAEAFKLERKIDPVLFVPLADDRFLLVYKWGKDLAWYRKLMVWPLRNIQSLLIAILSGALLFAAGLPSGWFDFNEHLGRIGYSVRMYIFFVVACAAVITAAYLHVLKNKSLSEDDWNSKYF